MQKLRAILHILFTFDPAARLDLFRAFPAIRRFFSHRSNIAILRTFGDIAFSGLIILGIFGPQDPERNITLFLAWGVWWTGVVLSWFFVGKLWCGVCPFLGIGRLLQKIGLSFNLEPPHALRRNFIHIAVLLFAAIIWAEAVTDLKHSPLGTALLLLSILAGATIMAVLFKHQAWCRYVCPLGKIIGAGATMSMIELRASQETCRTCRKTACKKGRPGLRGCPVYLGAHNVRNSLDCLLCGRCVLLCEKDSPRLLLRNPFVEVVAARGRELTSILIIPFLAGSQWARFIQESDWYFATLQSTGMPPPVIFTALLLLCFFAFIGLVSLGNRFLGTKKTGLPLQSSPMIPVLTPLALSGELIYRLDYLLTEAGKFPAVIAGQFNLPGTGLSFTIHPWLLNGLSLLLLVLGALGSLYVISLFQRSKATSMPDARSRQVLRLMVAGVALVYLLLIL
ncbi:MAG: 4Fe-4S binding protein [Desulforhopalus sp.]|nr:4Fe-4S binding protein [Desulforhopalus sp.]